MKYTVFILPEAKEDLFEIYRYVAEHDSIARAEALLDGLEEKCVSLCNHPERGHGVPELKRVYVESFREIHYKPYRIIFQISPKNVYVHAVLDGRRELQDLLERRMLR
ncbi:MAG: type II toxin-antitoxin system RelE/ParE family toxin [Chitinivibrionales bacterium]|nr:type II toxin-antitoxin system RelE/ParE family toxin [Chitinivibrionales bacterium]